METIVLSIKEIAKILNKGYYKGSDVAYINFRAIKGLEGMQIELGFDNYYLLVVSEEKFDIRVNKFLNLDLSSSSFVFGERLSNGSNHLKSLVSILAKTKKDIMFELVLFNDCDLYRDLNITSHEMYINLYDKKDRLERYLVDKYVGKQNGASPLSMF